MHKLYAPGRHTIQFTASEEFWKPLSQFVVMENVLILDILYFSCHNIWLHDISFGNFVSTNCGWLFRIFPMSFTLVIVDMCGIFRNWPQQFAPCYINLYIRMHCVLNETILFKKQLGFSHHLSFSQLLNGVLKFH